MSALRNFLGSRWTRSAGRIVGLAFKKGINDFRTFCNHASILGLRWIGLGLLGGILAWIVCSTILIEKRVDGFISFAQSACAPGTFTLATSDIGGGGGTRQFGCQRGDGTLLFNSLFNFTNHNGIQWTLPGTTPTVDQAVAAAPGGVAARIDISPGYTGAESASLVTTSVGYQVYPAPTPALQRLIFDNRGAQGTPGNPFTVPLYSIGYGQRCNGELTTECVNYWSTGSITDSTVTLGTFNWVQGTFPTNGGALMGASNLTVLHDSVTVGGNAPTSPIVGTDAEVWMDATSIDRPVPYAKAFSGQVVINRAGSLNRTTIGTVYHAVKCRDDVGNLINTCYGFDASGGQAGVNNWGVHNADSWLTEINTSFDFTDAGNTITTTSMSSTTATYNTSGVCSFTTGQKVVIGGVLSVNGGDYNGAYIVLTPGCNGGSSFTVTLPFSGLASSSGGIVRGLHKGTQWLSSDSSVTYLPMLDSVGWKWKRNSDNATIMQLITNPAGLQVSGQIAPIADNGTFLGNGSLHFAGLFITNCSSSSGACTNANSGAVSIAAAATTVTVAATNTTANSDIIITENSALGTRLGVTCNTTAGRTYAVTTLTAGTSFVITASAAPATNPACLTYLIVN